MVEHITERRGLALSRRFTEPGYDPLDLVAWDRRAARITADDGSVIFEQGGVEVPRQWSQIATNVVASKFFKGHLGSADRERSVKELLTRVVGTIARWGEEDRVFATPDDASTFEEELTYLIIHQMGSFNSPVWQHVGVTDKPQCSAAFINSVEDDMDAIIDLTRIEAMLFKRGGGTGTNLSTLRSSIERLSGGGTASGPVSFMRGCDAFAGVMLDGGTNRSTAKIAFLDVDHPDILEFIQCKVDEQRKAWALIDAGYDDGLDGEAYASVAFQNTETCVRVVDEYLETAKNWDRWTTTSRSTGEALRSFDARDILHQIALAVHECGAPAIQFDTTINAWNTCSSSGRIRASTPCGEFHFLDDTACNLASLNLMAFLDANGQFDVQGFKCAIDLFLIALEIIIDRSGYPTAAIEKNSHSFRPLGLGYTNLGALLLALGLPYDSVRGRAFATSVTALLTGEAFLQSAHMAGRFGPFDAFKENRDDALAVIDRHIEALEALDGRDVPPSITTAATRVWEDARQRAAKSGLRHAQVTAQSPAGTISFMMDCDTTGVEPEIALVKFRQITGGDRVKVVNHTVPMALRALRYGESQIKQIVEHAEEHGTIEGAPGLKQEHLAVFDCARRAQAGRRSISPMGHLRMMAAIQPFLSGAISKTVTLPRETTVEEVESLIMEAFDLDLKAISIHRESSHHTAPETRTAEQVAGVETRPQRRKLPDERQGLTHKFSIAGHEGYITVGLYKDGTPGEIFIQMAKAGSVVGGLMDAFALAVSLSLQYGVPLHVLVDKYAHSRFEPSGFTTNPQIPIAKSIMDYIFRWLGAKFLEEDITAPDEHLIEVDPDH